MKVVIHCPHSPLYSQEKSSCFHAEVEEIFSSILYFAVLPNFKVLFFLTQISSLAVSKEGNDVSIIQKLSVYSHFPHQKINTLIDQGKLSQN